ncbi:MAG TPA: alpha/beta hydrolase, partial [Gammaproteobacteria bacterium]|nr:alpha/beta hydrolase [Gammaproteobacteria bacterium]
MIPLPEGLRSRQVDNGNGLNMHVLEAGFETPDRPCVMLLHGFPELAYSWRKVMPMLAQAGYYVVAPDQRGYGDTLGWEANYDGDTRAFGMLNLVRDVLGLAWALDIGRVATVVGHDFGSPVAAYCALLRPDVFCSVAMMSAPFAGPPGVSSNSGTLIHDQLATLQRPRKHYQWYYSTPEANADMYVCAQGVHDFLRAYFHYKSADWPDNRPYPLAAWSAEELAKMPTYYIMDLDQNMAETVALYMPGQKQIARCDWLTEDELLVYSKAFAKTGFQGGLNWYRCATSETYQRELMLFADQRIDVPACFIAGKSDWGV